MSKRFFDICFSILILSLTFPIIIVISVAIKTTSPGPIFYGSTRAGKNGRQFTCWKFRTMCIHAEERLTVLLNTHPELFEEWTTYCKLKNDPRITKIGKFLRQTSLDELPQFWNVLIGDLSVVGPRPYLIEEIEQKVGAHAKKILSVRPGITGIWQTSGRNLLTFHKRVELEAAYIDKQSFLFDLILICKTIPLIIFRRGAY